MLELMADVPAWREDALAPLVSGRIWDEAALETLRVPCVPGDLWVRETEGGLAMGCGSSSGVVLGPGDACAVEEALKARVRTYLAWAYDLHAANREPAANLNGLLAVAWRLVGYSLVLFDGGFDFLAYAGDDLARSSALAQTIERGYAMGVSVAHQQEYRQLQTQYPEGFATMFDEGDRQTPVWVRTVRTRLGRGCQLHVMGLQAANVGVRELVEEVVAELRIMLERLESGTDVQLRDDFVQALVGRRLGGAEARQRARFFGWAENDAYRVARVVSVREQFAAARWGRIRDRLLEGIPHVHATVMGDGLTLVVPAAACDELGRFAETLNVTVGLSDERCDLAEAPDAYAEAVIAAERTACGCVGRYDDHKCALLVEALKREAHTHNVVPEFLRAIQAYDDAHGSSLVGTLKTLVACGGVKASACEVLAIHRSTLDYRLGRMRELFGIDPTSERVQRHLELLELAADDA